MKRDSCLSRHNYTNEKSIGCRLHPDAKKARENLIINYKKNGYDIQELMSLAIIVLDKISRGTSIEEIEKKYI